jgi:hypothetical protein
MQRLTDQIFRNIGAVGVGGIDKIHADFRQPPQRAEDFGAILRLTPDAIAGDAHGAEAKPVNFDVAADLEAAGFAGVELIHIRVPNVLPQIPIAAQSPAITL